MARITKKFWSYLPLLHIYIEIPFLAIRTMLMGRQYDSGEVEYIMLYIKLFKWDFEFKLYDTLRRIDDRYLQR